MVATNSSRPHLRSMQQLRAAPRVPLHRTQSQAEAPADTVPRKWALAHPGEQRSFMHDEFPYKPVTASGGAVLWAAGPAEGSTLRRQRPTQWRWWWVAWPSTLPHGHTFPTCSCSCPSRTTTATAACLCVPLPNFSRPACHLVRARRCESIPDPACLPALRPAHHQPGLRPAAHPQCPAALCSEDLKQLQHYGSTNRDLFEGTEHYYPGT